MRRRGQERVTISGAPYARDIASRTVRAQSGLLCALGALGLAVIAPQCSRTPDVDADVQGLEEVARADKELHACLVTTDAHHSAGRHAEAKAHVEQTCRPLGTKLLARARALAPKNPAFVPVASDWKKLAELREEGLVLLGQALDKPDDLELQVRALSIQVEAERQAVELVFRTKTLRNR